mgnify:CR=1 FL=1
MWAASRPNPCSCRRFRAAPKAKRRSIRAHGHTYERDSAEEYGKLWGAEHRGGVGEVDWIVFGPDALPLLAVEGEQSKRMTLPKRMAEKLSQAERMAHGLRGAPFPLFDFCEKQLPGCARLAGERVPRYVLMRRETLLGLLERLGDHGN